ncbi:MAG: hypothetical protein LCH89_11620 [Proteobacteria bacterium]|nr:hypothetical protein [Pseudomonadota bacterium]
MNFLHKPVGVLSVALVLAGLAGCQSSPKEPDKKNLSAEQILTERQKIDESAEATLARLYTDKPEARKEIEQAKGYGVFHVGMVNAILLIGATGNGVMVDTATGKRTYMRAKRAGTGPGVGYQRLAQVFVFKTQSAMEQFQSNNSGGLDVSASATLGTAGGQVSVNPQINVYQFTEKGFALQANWGGTAYFLDPDLN